MKKNKAGDFAKAVLFDRLIQAKAPALRNKIIKEKNAYITAQAETYKITGSISDDLLTAHQAAIYKIFVAHYEIVMRLAFALSKKITQSKKSRGKIEVKFSEFELFLIEFVTRFAAMRAKNTAQTTQDDIKRAVVFAFESGMAEAQVIKQILRAKGVSAYRADTIARTETGLAAAYAHRKQVEQYAAQAAAIGVTVKKKWVPVNDDRTRPWHNDMLDVAAIGIDQYFDVGGEKMWGPYDPTASAGNVINCRCVMITEDDF